MYLFPDTHFFLHFKHAHEIPWSEVTDDTEVHLVVGRAVNKELDKKKHEMRGRPQQRARLYVSKLASIARNRAPETLRAGSPRVMLQLQPARPPDWTAPTDLDPGWGDDVLLADALSFKHKHAEADVRVLTGDPGLMARAGGHGLEVVALTDRGWELSDEKTPEQKELENIRREYEDLKRVGPVIDCALELEGSGSERIAVSVTRYPPLGESQMRELLADLKERNPKATEFPGPLADGSTALRVLDLDSEPDPVEWRPPTKCDIDDYGKRYEAWLEEAEALLRSLHERIEAAPLRQDCAVRITNSGNNSALGARLYIQSFGDVVVAELDENEATGPAVPKEGKPLRKLGPPPTPPRWKRVPKPLPATTAKAVPGMRETLAVLGGNFPGSAAAALAAMGNMSPSIKAALALTRADNPHLGYLSAADTAAIAQGQQLYDSIGRHHRHILGAHEGSSHYPAANEPPFDPTLYLPKSVPPRDRHAFFEAPRPEIARDASSGLEFECEEFRHRMGTLAFRLRVSPLGDQPTSTRGALRVSMWAANLKTPFEKTFPVKFTVENGDVRAVAAGLLS